MLRTETDAEMLADAAAILGSLGHGDQHQQRLVAVPLVVNALRLGLDHGSLRTVEACLRSLKIIFRTKLPTPEVMF